MLLYLPLSKENIEDATNLVCSVFPDDCDSQDGPRYSYKASLDREEGKDFIERCNLDELNYFIVMDSLKEKMVGVTGWYTQKDSSDVVWLGWYCVDPQERGKGLGKEILTWTINTVKDKGYKIMKLYTSTDPNEAIAQNLYEKIGFKIIKRELKEGEVYETLYRECIL